MKSLEKYSKNDQKTERVQGEFSMYDNYKTTSVKRHTNSLNSHVITNKYFETLETKKCYVLI